MIHLTWYGHATWLLEIGAHRVLVDPFLNNSDVAPLKADDVACDFILITHGHFDHTADAVSIAKRTGASVVANWEICDWFGKQGVSKTLPMNIGGWQTLPFGRVKMTPAIHSSTLPDGAPAGNPSGYLIDALDRHIYIAGDTALFSDMGLIAKKRIDLAILPIGDLFTMGPEDSLEAVKLLQPKAVAPSHYNTWPPIKQDAAKWAESVQAETSADPIVTQPGEQFSV